ncbi:alpha/beta fold hydrolase [Citrobacter portucalensis]|uniref:alpha/beta fold hydrolase n=1 Tax=Citrobacter portucalensis TaxID=1639133 RepID=UPI003CFA106D
MKIIRTNGLPANIYLDVYGNGEPVLFLHGGPGCCHDSFAPFFRPLAEHCQVIYFDQLGCGQSDWNMPGEYHLDDELAVIEQIREHLGHQQLTVVGESWGTMLGLQYASKFPQRVKRLILLSSVGYGMEQMNLFGSRLMEKVSAAHKHQLADIDMQRKSKSIDAATALALSQQILNPYYLHDQINLPKVISQPINFEQHLRVISRFDEELDYLTRLDDLHQVEIHMYQATGDLINDRDILSILGDKLLPAAITAVPECGHWIYLEQQEYINAEILRLVS